MSYYCLLITLSWFGSASLQYINTGGPRADMVLDPIDENTQEPISYNNYFNSPLRNDFETYQNADVAKPAAFANLLEQETTAHAQADGFQRKRRTVDDTSSESPLPRWQPNLIDTDQTLYLKPEDNYMRQPYLMQQFASAHGDPNNTELIVSSLQKRSFSPWGGKRSTRPILENMWSWKRAANVREPSMPKRVRFSPWGGKRSGQLIYKPAGKVSKVIFSSSYIPELSRFLTKRGPNPDSINLSGFQFIPLLQTRHPFRVLALSAKLGDRIIREALPFNPEIEEVPKFYRPGHPYVDVNLKKDGKRKVKFSAWGGKRAPPIIGPIWTPSPQDLKDTTLNAILLIRNSPDSSEIKMTKAT